MNIEQVKTEAAKVNTARDRRTKITQLNRPTILNNRKIAKSNELRRLRIEWNELHPDEEQKEVPEFQSPLRLPYHLEPEYKATMKAETDNQSELNKITKEEWLRRIKELPNRIRNRIAALVWWDFFGKDLVADRSDLLDGYVQAELQEKSYKNLSHDEIILGLVSIGYSPYKAIMRQGRES